MNAPPLVPRARSSGYARLLLGVVLALLLAAAAAAVPGTARAATQICSNQTGTDGGYYYQMLDKRPRVGLHHAELGQQLLHERGAASATSSPASAGIPAATSTVNFSSSLSASGGTSLVSLYGWSTNPLVEYYVTENYVGSPNTAGTYMGQVTSDGGTYNLYEHQQVNQPCITGNAAPSSSTWLSGPRRSSGTITTQNFFNAWASHGMNLGTLNYQILATESYGGGSGNSSVTVNHGSGSGGGGVRGRRLRGGCAPRRCRPGPSAATGTTSTSRSPAPAPGP